MSGQAVAALGGGFGLVAGVVAGFAVGRRLRPRPRRFFWLASAFSLLLGMLVIFVGEVVGVRLITAIGVGLMTGTLNGIRWGFGRLSDDDRPDAVGADPPPPVHGPGVPPPASS